MRRHVNRHLGFIFIAILLITTLSGCGSFSTTNKSSKETYTTYDEFLTIDVFCAQANYQGLQPGWFSKVIKERFNMEINIIAPNVAGGGDTLFQTRTAAGNLGDIVMFGSENGKLSSLVNAGLLLDLSEYSDRLSNLLPYSNGLSRIKKIQGKEQGFYAFPSNVTNNPPTIPGESTEPTFGPYLRWDLYTQINTPTMKTLEDLLPVLKEMQAISPLSESGQKTYGFSLFRDWDGNMMMMGKQPTCFYGYDEIGFVLSKVDGTDNQSIIDDDSFYIRVLKMYFDANKMGLLDPESPTQNWDKVWNKYKDGSVLFSPWPWLGQSAYNTSERLNEGKGFMIASIEDMQILSYGATTSGNNYVVGIGSKAQDPERMADFINWLYSPEGIMMSTTQSGSTCGPEGLTWEMTESGPKLTEFGIKAMLEGGATLPESWGGGDWNDGISQLNFTSVQDNSINPDNGYSYDFRLWDSYIDFTSTPVHISWQNQMNAQSTFDYLKATNQLIVDPGNDFMPTSEPAQIRTLRARIRSEITAYSWSMVFAKSEEEFYDLLNTLQVTVKELGYDQVLQWDLSAADGLNAARDNVRAQNP
jgi:putative aldouronate transport system substrate-binding protein